MSKFMKTFLTDDDGVTAIDFLTAVIFFLYVIAKVFHIIVIFNYRQDLVFIDLIDDVLLDITVFMEMIIKFYFAIKGTSIVASYFLTKKTGKPQIITYDNATNKNEGGNI
jgi:hypothetical protein